MGRLDAMFFRLRLCKYICTIMTNNEKLALKMFYDIKSFDGSVLFGKNIICFMADILHYINTLGSAMADGIVRRNEAEQNVNVAYIAVDRTSTSINLIYNNMILIIPASSSIVLIRTAASYTLSFIQSVRYILLHYPFNDIPYSKLFSTAYHSSNVKYYN